MTKPFFSVIIPTYNQSSFLKKALESVLNQTYKNYEIIVIDNHSNDNTTKVIKKYKKKIIYKKIYNKGIIGKSRNLGIKIAKGKWIAFLDSDDFWMQNKLDTIHRFTKSFSFEVICHSEWILYAEKKNFNLRSYGPYKKNFYETLLRQGNKLSTSASIVKKDFLNKTKILFDENKDFISSEDYGLFLNLARKKANFFFIKQPLGCHLFHKKSVSSNLFKHFKARDSVVRHHIFNIQEFTKNKKKLWSEAKDFLNLKSYFFNFKKVGRYNRLKQIFFCFVNRPLFTIWYIQSLLFKKLKDYLIYLFYKSEM
tara:strand:- start:200 stop:1129 length:930 start_codon:yes stop_codon:yes gene_type:complete